MNNDIFEYLMDEGFEREDGNYYLYNDKDEDIKDRIAEWATFNSTAYAIESETVFDSPGLDITCISLACADECGGVYSYLFTVIYD
jgi:hypothetical protein